MAGSFESMPAVYHPSFGAEVPYTIEALSSDSETQTEQTISRMAEYVREDSEAPIIQTIAWRLAPLGASAEQTASNVWYWVKLSTVFVRDSEAAAPVVPEPELFEVLIRPVDLVRMRYQGGDCDDFAMLTAALLRALGVPAYFVTLAADEREPGRYSHVFVYAEVAPGRMMALDTSHGPYPGWEKKSAGKKRVWSVENPMMQLGGLGASEYDPYTGSWVDMSPVVGSPSSAASSGAPWWQNVISSGMKILSARYATPPAGTYIQTAGGVYSRGVPGAVPYPPTTTGISIGQSGSSSNLLLIGGLVVAGLVVFGMMRRG